MKQHLIVIIDLNKENIIAPKKYTAPIKQGGINREDSIKSAKSKYEKETGNIKYKAWYWENEI